MRVLLVEDDDMIGNAIQQALREASYGVDWVVDGDAALDSLACNPYQMVLLDLGPVSYTHLTLPTILLV